MTRAILTCSPDFVHSAIHEVRRQHPQITICQQPAPGYVLLESPSSFDKLTAPWRHGLPIYVHHAFPVHAVVPLKGERDDLIRLREAAGSIVQSEVTVQVRSTTEAGLSYTHRDIQQGVTGKPTAPCLDTPAGRILSVLIAPDKPTGMQAYMGVSWATQNLSPWPGGQIPITEAVPNGAGYKLLEALDVFGIRLRRGDHALDLGAAPGAWTTLLRKRGLRVTAVAPAPLYPWLTIDEQVIHQPVRAEDFLGRCQTVFELIVNDMKMDVQDSARLMVAYAQHLRDEGIAIMTLKLRDRNRLKTMDHSLRILRQVYKIIRMRQLVSNRKEVTLFLRRK